jgi:hypothetical protein
MKEHASSFSAAGLCAAALVLLLSGCATPAPSSHLTPPAADIPVLAGRGPVAIGEVSGGQETRSWDVPRIGNAAFREALTEALRRAQVLDERAPGATGGYRLSAEILSQDIKGTFDNTITLLVRYELTGPDGAVAWSDNLYAQHELSPGDVFSGQERMRRLQEVAMQDNLESLLEQLSRVLPGPEYEHPDRTFDSGVAYAPGDGSAQAAVYVRRPNVSIGVGEVYRVTLKFRGGIAWPAWRHTTRRATSRREFSRACVPRA